MGGSPALSDRAARCAWGRSPTQIGSGRPGGVAQWAPHCLSEVSSRQQSCTCLKTLTKSQELQTRQGNKATRVTRGNTNLVTTVAAAVHRMPVLGGVRTDAAHTGSSKAQPPHCYQHSHLTDEEAEV